MTELNVDLLCNQFIALLEDGTWTADVPFCILFIRDEHGVVLPLGDIVPELRRFMDATLLKSKRDVDIELFRFARTWMDRFEHLYRIAFATVSIITEDPLDIDRFIKEIHFSRK